MFLIDCDDQFLLDHLVALASQKNLRLTSKNLIIISVNFLLKQLIQILS